jgi:hypothetical protein
MSISWRVRHIAPVWGKSPYLAFAARKAGHGQSMESMESHEAGFPAFTHSLEIPSGFLLLEWSAAYIHSDGLS